MCRVQGWQVRDRDQVLSSKDGQEATVTPHFHSSCIFYNLLTLRCPALCQPFCNDKTEKVCQQFDNKGCPSVKCVGKKAACPQTYDSKGCLIIEVLKSSIPQQTPEDNDTVLLQDEKCPKGQKPCPGGLDAKGCKVPGFCQPADSTCPPTCNPKYKQNLRRRDRFTCQLVLCIIFLQE